MRRKARRFTQRLIDQFDDTKYAVTSFVRRSISDYHYPSSSTTVRPRPSPPISDTEDDLVFQGTEAEDAPTTDERRTSLTMIPCEFCTASFSSETVHRHQFSCPQNPNAIGRRRNATEGNLRRTASERFAPAPPAIPPRVPMPPPSAPPRSRSPSPTEGFQVPLPLLCPITHSLFHEPVLAADGHTYERAAIEGWLRTSQKSPITRENITLSSLKTVRVVKQMADDFRSECQRKRALYKYKLDVDVAKREPLTHLRTNTRSIYLAEWLKTNSKLSDTKIVLTHLTGTQAEKIGQVNCQVGPHPNLVRTFGRVEHSNSGILLVQEYLPERTLASLLQSPAEKFSITILDTIFSQIISAIQHLISTEICPGSINAENIFIYQLDDMLENNLVKLNNLGFTDENNRVGEGEELGEKSYVYELGLLAQDVYKLELTTNDEDFSERESLIKRCLDIDPNVRPSLTELTKTLVDLMHTKKFIFSANKTEE